MRYTLEIDMDNAAFGDAPGEELARILREAAKIVEDIDEPAGPFNLRDVNVNRVGSHQIAAGE